jgi:hypothetical protein
MVFLTTSFVRETAEERFDLKNLNMHTNAEEPGARDPEPLSLRLYHKVLLIEPFCMENSRKTSKPRVHREGMHPLLKFIRNMKYFTLGYK